MKSKDQQLLEEAYKNVRILKEESVDDFHNRMMKDEAGSSRLSDEEIITRYKQAVAFDDEGTPEGKQKFQDVALALLGDIVNGIEGFAPERDISEEEDEQMIAADLGK